MRKVSYRIFLFLLVILMCFLILVHLESVEFYGADGGTWVVLVAVGHCRMYYGYYHQLHLQEHREYVKQAKLSLSGPLY